MFAAELCAENPRLKAGWARRPASGYLFCFCLVLASQAMPCLAFLAFLAFLASGVAL